MRPLLRLVPDNTSIAFMRGRFAGLILSALLSTASIVLFFTPGLNYGIDFQGGAVIEIRLPNAPDLAALRTAFEELGVGEVKLQGFGSQRDVLVTLGEQAEGEGTKQTIRTMLATRFPGSEIRREDVVGARVSGELFNSSLLASALALGAVLLYVWFRFDWQFGVGVVATLLLDLTKTIGFFAVTQLQFDLNSVAALLLLIGYSVTDKVVVYDRIRENLRKYPSLAFRQLIDRSINQTLSRTVATSMTVLLSILPLAFMGSESIRDFAMTIIFGIVVGTSSSIFIASPILLFLRQGRLGAAPAPTLEKPAPASQA
jgi:preprotein translocase subunit SecF